MKKRLAGLMIACLLLFLGTAAAADSAALTFDRDSLILPVGRYITMHVTIVPAGAIRSGVIYSISDESVATVDPDGKVRGIGAGECTLTATSKYDETVSVTIPVTVVVPVREISIDAGSASVAIGGALQVSVQIVPADATLQSVTYSSSDEGIFTVSADGLITGVARGRATLTATSADGRAKAQIRITVKQPPLSVTADPGTLTLAEGKSMTLKASVLPANASDKTILWSSADESIATVSAKGTVKGVKLGQTVITAACKDNPDVTFSVPVSVLKLATGVEFNQSSYDVLLGQTLQLSQTVLPSTTSNQAVTYKVGSKRIATVDENGLVTALRGGATTVTVTTVDGSRKSDTAKINVLVPVTGVNFPRSDVRVGQGYYSHVTVNLEPSDATNHAMAWSVADPGVATVTGDTNTVKIEGKAWGRTRVTGVTADGGYSVTFNVNVGSLYRAVTVRTLEIRNGAPYLSLRNSSDMTITQVRYTLKGYDSAYQPVKMSVTGDPYSLLGTYDLALYPGESTQHNMFTFFAPSDYPNLTYLTLTLTGWSTSTGYYDTNGMLQYEYTIGTSNQSLTVYPKGTDPTLFNAP